PPGPPRWPPTCAKSPAPTARPWWNQVRSQARSRTRSQAPGQRWPVRRAGDATGGTRPTLTVPSEGSDAQGNDDTDGEPGRQRRLALADARGRDGRIGEHGRGP